MLGHEGGSAHARGRGGRPGLASAARARYSVGVAGDLAREVAGVTNLSTVHGAHVSGSAKVVDAFNGAAAMGLTALKLGTEEEALGPDEVAALAALAPTWLGKLVKIGGPCARADLRLAHAVGATAVIAPMIESPFAMLRFLEAADDELGADRQSVARAFNLETGQALAQLDALLDVPGAAQLGFVNIGRSDLGASLGLQVGDEALHDVVADAIARLHARGFEVHVGGKVTRATLEPLLARAPFAMFHTRFLAFRVGPQVGAAIDAALHIELSILEFLAERDPLRAPEHWARAQETQRRLRG